MKEKQIEQIHNLFLNSHLFLIDDCIKPHSHVIRDINKIKENDILIKLEYYDPFEKKAKTIELQKNDLLVAKILNNSVEFEYGFNFSVHFYNLEKIYL